MPNNPPKNDAPDKALVEALEPFKQALADCEGAPDDMAIGDASYSTVLVGDIKRLSSALSQPQHGGLVEALRKIAAFGDPYEIADNPEEFGGTDDGCETVCMAYENMQSIARAALGEKG